MKERNLCHESGCPDLCCANTFSKFTSQELTKLFPEAIKVPRDQDVRRLDKGVYVLKKTKDGKLLTYIAGRCPHNINGCSASPKPRFCQDSPFGGLSCNEFRKKAGLNEIILDTQGEIIYQASKKSLLGLFK